MLKDVGCSYVIAGHSERRHIYSVTDEAVNKKAKAALAAGRARQAETVYWEDLKRNRENGWALFGLASAIEAQGRKEQAALIRARFEKAWARADFKLTASRLAGSASGDD